jgi:AraC-like DNA-binding protein
MLSMWSDHAEKSSLNPDLKDVTGQTVMQYIAHQRMARAKALLSHTDYPVHIVAEKVGYQDVSAFSRRFSKHFGVSPKTL